MQIINEICDDDDHIRPDAVQTIMSRDLTSFNQLVSSESISDTSQLEPCATWVVAGNSFMVTLALETQKTIAKLIVHARRARRQLSGAEHEALKAYYNVYRDIAQIVVRAPRTSRIAAVAADGATTDDETWEDVARTLR